MNRDLFHPPVRFLLMYAYRLRVANFRFAWKGVMQLLSYEDYRNISMASRKNIENKRRARGSLNLPMRDFLSKKCTLDVEITT